MHRSRRASPAIDRPSSLKDSAYRTIKDLLVSGQLDHDKIYSAQHFAMMLGVSRTPIREAMLQLAGEGFLVYLEARGFKIKQFSERGIRDVFETRRMIETFVAKQVLEKLTPEDIRPLKENLRVMAEHAQRGSAHGFMEADKGFHLSLVRRTGDQMLASIMETIRNHIAIFGLKASQTRGAICGGDARTSQHRGRRDQDRKRACTRSIIISRRRNGVSSERTSRPPADGGCTSPAFDWRSRTGPARDDGGRAWLARPGAGGGLILLPELWPCGYFSFAFTRARASPQMDQRCRSSPPRRASSVLACSRGASSKAPRGSSTIRVF